MSYNGIGLATAKGSGTSGFVQRIDTVKQTQHGGRQFLERQLEQRKEQYNAKMERQQQMPCDAFILEHERDRVLEVMVSEYADSLSTYDEDLISKYRNNLLAQSYKGNVNPFSTQKS